MQRMPDPRPRSTSPRGPCWVAGIYAHPRARDWQGGRELEERQLGWVRFSLLRAKCVGRSRWASVPGKLHTGWEGQVKHAWESRWRTEKGFWTKNGGVFFFLVLAQAGEES